MCEHDPKYVITIASVKAQTATKGQPIQLNGSPENKCLLCAGTSQEAADKILENMSRYGIQSRDPSLPMP